MTDDSPTMVRSSEINSPWPEDTNVVEFFGTGLS